MAGGEEGRDIRRRGKNMWEGLEGKDLGNLRKRKEASAGSSKFSGERKPSWS